MYMCVMRWGSVVVYLALYEDNTDMHLNVYLLECVNEVLFTLRAHTKIYICGAPHHLHDADLLCYQYKSGCVS